MFTSLPRLLYLWQTYLGLNQGEDEDKEEDEYKNRKEIEGILEVEDEDDNEELVEDEDEDEDDVEVVDTDVTVMMLVRFVRAGWPSFTHLLLTERGGEGEGEVKAQLHSGSVNDNDASDNDASDNAVNDNDADSFFYGDSKKKLFLCEMSFWDKLKI